MTFSDGATAVADERMPHDGTSLGAAIRSGRIGAVEAMEAAITAAERHAGFGAVNWLDTEMGMEQARALDAMRAADPAALDRMPFAGVPFLVKDLGSAFAGIPVHAGSAALAGRLAPAPGDSELAARFRRSGLLPFGRTTVPEFGLSLTSEPDAFPPARNPLDPSRTAGGSSGGAAAAVALGIVPLAHATDAGGSIRVPAACCGLVGLKPSRGAVPEGPDFANHLAGLASELVIARSARDVRASLLAVAGAARGPMPDAVLARQDAAPRIGIFLPEGVAPDRSRAVEAAARHLESLGSRVEPIETPALEDGMREASRLFDRVICTNLAMLFDALRIEADEVEPLSAAVAERGRAMSAVDLFEALQAGIRVAHAMARLFGHVDALLMPMLAQAPLPLGSFPTSGSDVEAHWRRMADFAPGATLANAAGLPAATVPFGVDENGLPLPVQILGPIGSDLVLLDLAELLEAERPFRLSYPLAGFA